MSELKVGQMVEIVSGKHAGKRAIVENFTVDNGTWVELVTGGFVQVCRTELRPQEWKAGDECWVRGKIYSGHVMANGKLFVDMGNEKIVSVPLSSLKRKDGA